VEYGSEAADLPPFIRTAREANGRPPTYQFRLREVLQPTEQAAFYRPGTHWISAAAIPANTNTLATNIIALILLPAEGGGAPISSLSDNYRYDSRVANATPQPVQQHRLPPVLRVAMVALDQKSADRVCTGSTPPDLIKGPRGEELFQSTSNFSADLEALGLSLSAKQLHYRIFNAELPLKSGL
jgi:uncharacterized protein (TIGR02599 family)